VGPGMAIAACAAGVAALLAAEHRSSQRGIWLAKPWASLSFIFVALASGALETTYGGWILLGLLLCLAGDLLLIPVQRPKFFRAGVFAFLLGHVAFAAAFLTQPRSDGWLAGAAIALALLLALVWRWLAPSLPADMKQPVVAYFIVIGTMSALACAVTAAGGPAGVAVGALAFAASDVAVARDRFVQHDFRNRAWGLPLYYFAQVLLALTPAAVV
jgi:uncharacterized membrane protein YhhN